MTDGLPRVTTRDHAWLAAICARLDEQTRLLRHVLDRLPQPARQDTAGGRVELREPKKPAAPEAAAPAPETAAGSPAPATTRPRTRRKKENG